MTIRTLIIVFAFFAIACQSENILPETIDPCEQLEIPVMDHSIKLLGYPRKVPFLSMPELTFVEGDSLHLTFSPQYMDSAEQRIQRHHLEIGGDGLEVRMDSIAGEGWWSDFHLHAQESGIYTLSYSAEIDRVSVRDSSQCGTTNSEVIVLTIEIIKKVQVVIESITIDLPHAGCDYDIAKDDVKKCPDVDLEIRSLKVYSNTSWNYNFQKDGPLTKMLGDTVTVVENYWQPHLLVIDEDGLIGHNRGMAGFDMVPEEMGFWQSGRYLLNSDVQKWESGTAEIVIKRLE
ncbi:MAG: hypothetical protein AAF587_28980 [Bacteroidota bacterium]